MSHWTDVQSPDYLGAERELLDGGRVYFGGENNAITFAETAKVRLGKPIAVSNRTREGTYVVTLAESKEMPCAKWKQPDYEV